MTDIWVCGNCHSINRQRDDRCYKCGERQLDVATGALEDTRVQTARQVRRVIRYASSMPFAVAAVGLLIAVGALGLLVLLVSLPAIQFVRDSLPQLLETGAIDQSRLLRLMSPTIIPSALHLAASILGLVAVGLWLYRVIQNIPALGGGIPETSPFKAFVYTIIPGVNLAKVPPLIQDVLYRVEPRKGGFFMVLLAWFGLVGSRFVSFGVNWWAGGRMGQIVFEAEDVDTAIREIARTIDVTIWTDLATAAMSAAGAVVLAGVIIRYESRAKARDAEIRAAGDPLPPMPPPVLIDAAAPAVGAPAPAPASTAAGAVPLDAAPPAPAATPLAPAPASAAGLTPGPLLLVVLTTDGMTVSVDGGEPEPTTLDELVAAAPALAHAGGTATIEARGGGDPMRAKVGVVAAALRASGVTTRTT